MRIIPMLLAAPSLHSNEKTPCWVARGCHRFRNLAVKELEVRHDQT